MPLGLISAITVGALLILSIVIFMTRTQLGHDYIDTLIKWYRDDATELLKRKIHSKNKKSKH